MKAIKLLDSLGNFEWIEVKKKNDRRVIIKEYIPFILMFSYFLLWLLVFILI